MITLSHPPMLPATPDPNFAAGPDPIPPPDPAAWEEAFVRVESYLRAHRLERRTRLTQLTAQLVEQAQATRLPTETPVAAAMRTADLHIKTWIEQAVGTPDEDRSDLILSRARLALEIADIPERWPDAFLSSAPVPPELQAAIRSAYVEAGPELKFSNMHPRPIDLGPVANLAGQTWDRVRRRPRLRFVLSLLTVAATAALVWHLLRP